MSEKYWHQLIIGFLIVAIGMSITWLVSRASLKRQHARRTYDTYVLGDGVVNSVTLTIDVKLGEAERRRILSEHGKVLATYAPAFNPNSAMDAQPLP
jgi:hypothetical protein